MDGRRPECIRTGARRPRSRARSAAAGPEAADAETPGRSPGLATSARAVACRRHRMSWWTWRIPSSNVALRRPAAQGLGGSAAEGRVERLAGLERGLAAVLALDAEVVLPLPPGALSHDHLLM